MHICLYYSQCKSDKNPSGKKEIQPSVNGDSASLFPNVIALTGAAIPREGGLIWEVLEGKHLFTKYSTEPQKKIPGHPFFLECFLQPVLLHSSGSFLFHYVGKRARSPGFHNCEWFDCVCTCASVCVCVCVCARAYWRKVEPATRGLEIQLSI